ncbi:hypothetical protein D3C78_1491650 [compost metagenome]
MLCADVLQQGIVRHPAIGHQIIGRHRHPVFARGRNHLRLVEIGVIFDLVGGKRRVGKFHCFFGQRHVEVGNADIAHLSGLAHRVQRAHALGKRHIALRPVQQQEINIVSLQFCKAFIDGGEKIVVTKAIHPDLGGEKYIVAGNA